VEQPVLFSKVLIANRGEIAVRIIRTLRAMGIRSVAVYSDADAGARHVTAADEAVRIGPAAAAESYLSIPAIIGAAQATGAEAIHPGYGFLAENPRLADACEQAGLTFIGPPSAAIEAMGDKIAAKARVSAAGVPVVPEINGTSIDPNAQWFPVLVKPSAGGGGKGMILVRTPEELPAAVESAKRTAKAAFGDDRLLIERYVDRPRHIEIQVLADTHGNVIHLGERECSLQRRHQKIIEEAPSPFLDPARRKAMGAAAVEAARSAGYVGAGTVEFIVDGGNPDSFYFMEMNTRLQVEHPVTELVTGLDLVEWQVRVAAGEALPFSQPPAVTGHAVEARLYAEDPSRGFLPTGGTVRLLREPAGPHVRVDSGLAEGTEVTSAYDPMLAKVIAWGEDRASALRRLSAALADTTVLGVTTNTAFLRALLADPDVRAGRLDTTLAERVATVLADQARAAGTPGTPPEVLAAGALARLLTRTGSDPWDIPDGWRAGGPAWTTFRFRTGDGHALVLVRGLASEAAEVMTETPEGGRDPVPVPASAALEGGGGHGGGGHGPERTGASLLLRYGGRTFRFSCVTDSTGASGGTTTWLGRDGQSWALTEERAAPARGGGAASADGTVRSPMPGTVLAVRVNPGEQVTSGQPLLVVEAMKMEHAVSSPVSGVVSTVNVKAGQQVQMDETLAVIEGQEKTADAELPPRSRARGPAHDGRRVRPRRGRPGHRGPVRARRVPVRDRGEDGPDGPVRPAGQRGVRRDGR
jgi:acetyl-CoA/propionyl-CoA carboxylase biotin carboxyl carrier protein